MAESRQTRRGARRPVAFISHHSSQDQTARHLKGVLGRHGVEGWMAPDDIEPGVSFDRAIIDQLHRSDMIILLFCARSDQSKHVKRELMLAEDNNKLVYPVRLEAIEPKGLSYWLQDYQWIDWIDRRDATIGAMVATVKRQIAAADAARTEAAPRVEPPAEPAVVAAPLTAVAIPVAAPPPPETGGRGGLGRYSWLGIGVIGALLAALLAPGIFMMWGQPDSRDAGGERAANEIGEEGEDIAADAERAGGETAPFLPGRWRTRSRINEVDYPGLSDEELEQMAQRLNASRTTDERCVSPEDARDPRVSFFNVDPRATCLWDEPYIVNGEIDIDMVCTDASGMPSEINMRGSYTPTEFTLNLLMTMESGPGIMTLRGVATGEHLGECS